MLQKPGWFVKLKKSCCLASLPYTFHLSGIKAHDALSCRDARAAQRCRNQHFFLHWNLNGGMDRLLLGNTCLYYAKSFLMTFRADVHFLACVFPELSAQCRKEILQSLMVWGDFTAFEPTTCFHNYINLCIPECYGELQASVSSDFPILWCHPTDNMTITVVWSHFHGYSVIERGGRRILKTVGRSNRRTVHYQLV